MTADIRAALISAVALALLPIAAQAQVAIDMSAISAGGITPGDAPGFPATISIPGSYKLTGNVTTAGAGLATDAIDITGDDVVLDLNGFSVSGKNSCTRMGVGNSCNGGPTGSQDLIKITGNRAVVKNGNVFGSGGTGVEIEGDNAKLERISVSQSAYHGINVVVNGTGPSIVDSTIALNGAQGVTGNAFGYGGLIENDTFSYNYSGVQIDEGVIRNVVANKNAYYGISAGNSTVTGVTATGNGGVGIYGGRVVRDSVANENASVGFDGSSSSDNNVYVNDSASYNSGNGFTLNSASCYSNIQSSGNSGTQISGGVQLTGTHVTCP